jgi:hypothetical protein
LTPIITTSTIIIIAAAAAIIIFTITIIFMIPDWVLFLVPQFIGGLKTLLLLTNFFLLLPGTSVGFQHTQLAAPLELSNMA